MRRTFRLTGARNRRPYRLTDEDQYEGVEVGVVSVHIKSQPVETVRLSDLEALRLATELVAAVSRRLQ